MAGMQFEYDEKGGNFYYFLLSFLALILIPATYYLWPRKKPNSLLTLARDSCRCDPCRRKRQRLLSDQPWIKIKARIVKIILIFGWILFVLVAYKTSTIEVETIEYDPFVELGVDRGASAQEIKKAYRELSRKFHPDKPEGDQKRFVRINKAYNALTDEESKKNWEEHGNPDGPGATHFGIALPKWIVEKQNSVWVLAVYGIVFMVALPVAVGTWWYRSIKYSAEQILMDTTQLYYYFLHKTPNMIIKRVLMVVAASLEFEKGHNSEINERQSDNKEVPLVMKDLPFLNEKNKEKPLCYSYSMKARTLLHAHLTHLDLPPKTLEHDLQYILHKCPYLINEMVNIVAQLVALARQGRVSHMPRLETIENIMRCSQMIIQALWDNKSPLLQLPHIEEETLRHFVTKKRNIRNIKQLVSMKEDERRMLLRTLSDENYQDVINVASAMPFITMKIKSEVLDDGDTSVTAGSIVTVTAILERKCLGEFLNQETEIIEEKNEPEDLPEQVNSSPKHKNKVWEKQKKKKGGKPNAKAKKKVVYQRPKTVTTLKPLETVNARGSGDDGTNDVDRDKVSNSDLSTKEQNFESEDVQENLSEDESNQDEELNSSDEEIESHIKDTNTPETEDEDDWGQFQMESKKESSLETKSKETHIVHAPFFPDIKYEWWWLYVADRKNHNLITAPVQITSLKSEEEVQMKFTAPPNPGLYQYTVILKSDSYFDIDQIHNFKLDVKEGKIVETHPQWDISDDENDKDLECSDSELSNESEESEEE